MEEKENSRAGLQRVAKAQQTNYNQQHTYRRIYCDLNSWWEGTDRKLVIYDRLAHTINHRIHISFISVTKRYLVSWCRVVVDSSQCSGRGHHEYYHQLLLSFLICRGAIRAVYCKIASG